MARRRWGPKVEWKVSVPTELALNIELLFMDPSTKKPDYGARSALIVGLLQNYWLNLAMDKKIGVLRTTHPDHSGGQDE